MQILRPELILRRDVSITDNLMEDPVGTIGHLQNPIWGAM